MLLLKLITTLILFISLLIMFISSLLSKKWTTNREKNSPFECGFDPKSSARLPFSLRFFLIAVIFLIFDVEITLLLPIIAALNLSIKMPIILVSLFLIALLLGLYYEWENGALEWAE